MTKTTTTILIMVARLAGLVALLLGTAYWLTYDVPLPLHMACGALLVIALWGLAIQVRSQSIGLALLAALWGLFIPVLAIMQLTVPVYLQMEEAQTVLRGLHVAAGLCTIGLAEYLAKRVRTA